MNLWEIASRFAVKWQWLCVGVLAMALSVSVSAHGGWGDIDDAMEDMQRALRGVHRSIRRDDPMDTIQNNVARLHQAIEAAEAMTGDIHNEQARMTYAEGMKKLLARMDAIASAFEQGDMEMVRDELRNLGQLRQRYHKKLDVKD